MKTQTVIEGVTPPPSPKRTDAMVKAAVLAYINRNGFEWGHPDQASADIAKAYFDGMNAITKFAVAMSAAIALCVAGVLMDGQPTELQAAQDVAEAVDELQYQAIVDEGGKAFCAQFGRVPHFRPDGDLICRESAPVVAQGGAL